MVASTAWSGARFPAYDQLDVQLPNRMSPPPRTITALALAPVASATAIVQPPPSSDPPTRSRPPWRLTQAILMVRPVAAPLMSFLSTSTLRTDGRLTV